MGVTYNPAFPCTSGCTWLPTGRQIYDGGAPTIILRITEAGDARITQDGITREVQ